MQRDSGIVFGTTPMMPEATVISAVSILVYELCSSFCRLEIVQTTALVNKIAKKLMSQTNGWKIFSMPSQCGRAFSTATVNAYSTYARFFVSMEKVLLYQYAISPSNVVMKIRRR